MVRICLKCNAYYADESLAFCLADGTPLVNLDPGNENWTNGVRVIQESENALKKQKRNSKWRRILMSAITTLIVTMVVCAVVVTREEVAPPMRSTLVTAPTPTPTPTQTPASTATPTPTASPTPSPTPTATPTPSPTPSPTPTPQCSKDDESREGKSIILKFGKGWRRKIEDNPPRNEATGLPPDHEKATLGPLQYDITFSKDCKVAHVVASFKWYGGIPLKVLNAGKKEKFECEKTGGTWQCR